MRRSHLLTGLAMTAMLTIGVLLGRHFDPAAPLSATAIVRDGGGVAEGPHPAARVRPTPGAKPTSRKDEPASRALPPPGSPLKPLLAELHARAGAGDADAASRLYRDLHRCAAVRDANQDVAVTAQRILSEKSEKMSPDQLKYMNTVLGALDERLKFARDNAALCAGVESADLDALVPATMQAAQLGDDKAANCYLGSDLLRQPGLLDHPEWLVDFKQNALNIANSAIAHGDWTAVKQLSFAYRSTSSASLLSKATGFDPAQAYRYFKLWSLGTAAGTKQFPDTEISAMARQLAPDAIASGDAWAQDTYRRFFSGVPVDASGSVNICQLKDM